MSLLSLIRPSADHVDAIVRDQTEAALTYDAVGGTRGTTPEGWAVDDQEVLLGHGRPTFERAVDALRRWAQFDLPWVWPVRSDVPIREGESFAFLAHQLGVWSINVCRVVYVIDEDEPDGARFGFAYGTVGAHSVRGEERFLVRWDRATDEVHFGIRKFSLPASLLLTVLGPVTRWVQGRFTHDALERLVVEVGS